MVGSPWFKQGLTMLKMLFSTPIRIIISSTVIALLISLVILFTHDINQCTVSDFDPESPYENTQRSFTQLGACKKAYAICTLYSSQAKNCAIKTEHGK